MSTILAKGVVQDGRIEVEAPIDLPNGTEVIVSTAKEEDRPMTPAEIAQVLAAMEKIEPFDMTPEEEAEIEAGRQAIKEYMIAKMNKRIEGLFE
jgi:hypothetical protein